MNVLMVYPEFPDTFWSFRHALRFIHKRAYTPPLGLLTVAAMLPSDWDVRLRDLNVEPIARHDLEWADCAFISAMHVQRASAQAMIDRCRQAGVRVVAGGPLFTHEPQTFETVDHLILGEAELVLPGFLDDLRAGRAKHLYRAEGYAPLEQSPLPRFELANRPRYASMGVQYSRGCPFACEFCDVTALLGRQTRTKSVPQVLAELDRLADMGWQGRVFFVDDNLIGQLNRVKNELLPALAEWQKRRGPMTFCSQVSINLADDPELIERMVQAGFDTVFVGIETPDSDALTACQKHQNTRRDLLADVRRIQQAGIQVQGGFIVGFDHESPTIFQRQVSFIQSAGIVSAMVGTLQAISGTRLHQRLQRESRLLGESTGNNVSGGTNFVTTMDGGLLRQGYAYVLRSLYAPEAYYRRVRTFLSQYKRPVVRLPLKMEDVRAFGRSIILLGLLGRERLQFWHLLAWTLRHHPRLLSTAVGLAIVGRHYRRVCQAIFREPIPELPPMA